jgi:hypothetical protein
MQVPHFTYDELTPLEQCIADFMARQEHRQQRAQRSKERNPRELSDA